MSVEKSKTSELRRGARGPLARRLVALSLFSVVFGLAFFGLGSWDEALAQESGSGEFGFGSRAQEDPTAPAPLSPHESRAVEWVASYLAGDPAIRAEPLAAELTRLFGDPSGSTWRLATARESAEGGAFFEVELPSGAAHWVRLGNAGAVEAEDLGPSTLRLASEASWRGRFVPGAGSSIAGSGAASASTREASEVGLGDREEKALGLVLAALAALGISFFDRRARVFFQVVSGLALIAAVTIYFGWIGLGSDRGDEEATASAAAAGGERGQVAKTRNRGLHPHYEAAQRALAGRRLGEADRYLQKLPSSPAVGLLEARLAFERFEVVEAALAYEKQLEIWPELDAILYEVTRAFETLDYADRAEAAAARLVESGTRRADYHYYLARRAALDRSTTRALAHFRRAWELGPLHRQTLLQDPVLAYLVFESPELRRRIAFDSPIEPMVPCRAEPGPIEWPTEASVQTLGALLWMELADATRLEVPGGCGLAPAGHPGDDAETWRQRREERILSRLAAIGVEPATSASGTRGAGATAETRTAPEVARGPVPFALSEHWPRGRMAEAVEVLARRGNWQALAALTEDRSAEGLDTESVHWRAWALQSMGREADAGRLLVELVTSDMLEKRADPSSYRMLAEWLVKRQDYDRAMELLARADELVPYETGGRRLLQVRMEKRLFRSAAEETNAHFRLIFPPEQSFLYANEVFAVLESERNRLARFVPRVETSDTPAEKIDVLMLDGNDFRASYGGMNVIGLFDGRIRLPLGEVPTLHTEIAVIDAFLANLITHELAHALIAEATLDRAPHWFQEGLAQHVEPVQQHLNPIPGLADHGTWIPFPLIDAVLKYSRIPQWTQVAYDQVRWIVHWIEAEHGIGAIHALLTAFRNGEDTEQAIARVFSLDLAELDRELVRWGREEAPEIWETSTSNSPAGSSTTGDLLTVDSP